jgi:hypothetical protein
MTADPWALLREARDRLSLHMETYFSQQNGSMFLTIDLVNRIDAALAGRQDSATDVVEWTKGASEDDYTYAQLDSDTYVDVIQADGQWRWSALREQGCGGYCATEAEAKSAAIAAARGMR